LCFKGEFPGPTIEARSGDTIVVSIKNSLKDEGVSIHWHGLHMRGENSMDGAVGFTQSPILPGKSFIYKFTIKDQDGTFWYHAHSHVQRGDGLYGGLIVHRPIDLTDGVIENEVMVLASDWFHRSAGSMLDRYTSVKGFGNEVRN
jgi:FtsP/CotA-like multicopper oxidase with cupredoxin domain